MRREIPLALTIIFGLYMVLDFFIPHGVITDWGAHLREWTIVVAAAAVVLGVLNVGRIHLGKIRRREKDSAYSIFLILGLVIMAGFGVGPAWLAPKVFSIEEGKPFDFLYLNAYVPMQGTMFSLLAFYIASAAFRAFRIRSIDAALLAVAAVLVMIGRVPVGNAIWDKLPEIQSFIMDYPNLAAKRAILIGAALGAISTGMKIILGIERNILGGGS